MQPKKSGSFFFDEDNNDLSIEIYYIIEGIPAKLDNLEIAFKP